MSWSNTLQSDRGSLPPARRSRHAPSARLGRYLTGLLLAGVLFAAEYLLTGEQAALTQAYEIQLLAVYGLVLLSSIRRFGPFNLFTLVLVGYFIFAVGGIFHYVVSGEDILEISGIGLGEFYFTNEIMQRSLLIYTLFFVIAYLTYRFIHNRQETVGGLLLPRAADKRHLRIGKWLMWGFLGIELYRGYLYFNSFSADRVLIYLYGNMENPVPAWVRFLAEFFEIGYAFVLCSCPDKRLFKRYSLLFFVVMLPEILLGNRGKFGAYILFYLWYYARFYNARPIKLKYMVLLGAGLLFLFQGMQYYRDGDDLTAMSYSLTLFLKGQAISFYLLPIYMQQAGAIQYYIYPFILYNIIGGFSGYTGQSVEVLQHKCGVGHQLMYTINPDYYLGGNSLGSSSITELYDLGLTGLAAGAVLLPVMLRFLERKFATSRFALFLSYSLLTQFFLSARSSFFPSFYNLFKLTLFYLLINFCYKIFTRHETTRHVRGRRFETNPGH